MDRRQKKTRKAIFRAFSKLLEQKRYESITVQEIIDEADVGRSTFYAHFETKDELLRALCTDIFDHVFSEQLQPEQGHDYSAGDKSLEQELEHVLHHLKENRGNLKGLLTGESGGLFLRYFKEYLAELFGRYQGEFRTAVPAAFLLHHLVGSFAETVNWWVAQNMQPAPETVAEYYIAVIAGLRA